MKSIKNQLINLNLLPLKNIDIKFFPSIQCLKYRCVHSKAFPSFSPSFPLENRYIQFNKYLYSVFFSFLFYIFFPTLISKTQMAIIYAEKQQRNKKIIKGESLVI